jgi:hypothetical protein
MYKYPQLLRSRCAPAEGRPAKPSTYPTMHPNNLTCRVPDSPTCKTTFRTTLIHYRGDKIIAFGATCLANRNNFGTNSRCCESVPKLFRPCFLELFARRFVASLPIGVTNSLAPAKQRQMGRTAQAAQNQKASLAATPRSHSFARLPTAFRFRISRVRAARREMRPYGHR